MLDEIDTAGCVLGDPFRTQQGIDLCESGRLLTVTLDAQGHEASRAMSDKFFDPDIDPIFVQGVPITDGFAFLSFLGEVHEVDFSGAQPAFHAPWSLVTAADKAQNWRPGGNAGRARSTASSGNSSSPCTAAAKAPTRTAAPKSGCST